jgi:hypothetical protein
MLHHQNHGDLVAIEIGRYDSRHPPEHYMNYFTIVYRFLPETRLPDHKFLSELEVFFTKIGKA